MAKVYLVEELVDTEYGNRETRKVFADKVKAEEWMKKHQEQVSAWFSEEPLNIFTIREIKLE